MSPKRSNSAKVSSLLTTCGVSSARAVVAATYHCSPMRTRSLMSGSVGNPGRRTAGRTPRFRQGLIDIDIAAGHAGGGEALLEHLATAPPVDPRDLPGRGDGLMRVTDDVTGHAVFHHLGNR